MKTCFQPSCCLFSTRFTTFALLLAIAPALLAQQTATATANIKTPAAQQKLATQQIAILDKTVAPGLSNILKGRPCVPWGKSKLYMYFPRTTVGAGAAAGGVTLRVNQKLGDFVAGDTLSSLLTLQAAPSKYSAYPCPYVTLTRAGGENSYEARLAKQILDSTKNDLLPQDVLRMSMDICGNDYWLATLTAHNLLKEFTYASRGKGAMHNAQIGVSADDPSDPGIFISPDKLIGKLAPLRHVDDNYYKSDKMGPWYHFFGALFFAGLTGSTEMNVAAFYLEVRSDPDDYFKKQLNYWAARQSKAINALVANPGPGLAPVEGVASELAVQLAVMGTFTASPSDAEIAAAEKEYWSRQSKTVSLLAGPMKMRAPWWDTANEANKVVIYVQYNYEAPRRPEQYVMLLKYDMAKQEYRFSGVMMQGVKRSKDDKSTCSQLMPKDMIYLRDGWIEDKKPVAPPSRPQSTATIRAYGVVVDARSNQPVPDVAVTVLRPGRSSADWIQAGFPSDWVLAQAISDKAGKFTFDQPLLRATTLSLVAACADYAPVRYDALSIKPQEKEPVRINIKLTPKQ